MKNFKRNYSGSLKIQLIIRRNIFQLVYLLWSFLTRLSTQEIDKNREVIVKIIEQTHTLVTSLDALTSLITLAFNFFQFNETALSHRLLKVGLLFLIEFQTFMIAIKKKHTIFHSIEPQFHICRRYIFVCFSNIFYRNLQ